MIGGKVRGRLLGSCLALVGDAQTTVLFKQCLCIRAGCCGWPGANLHTQPRGPGPRCASGPGQAPSAQLQEGAGWGPCLPGPGEWGPQPQGPVSTGLSWGSTISLCNCRISTPPLHWCAK